MPRAKREAVHNSARMTTQRRYNRLRGCLHHTGKLLEIMSLMVLLPALVVAGQWGRHGDGFRTLLAFLVPSALTYLLGTALRRRTALVHLDLSGSMLMCAISWLVFSAFGALPFTIGIGAGYLDSYFEAMSGFTTTGITVFAGLDDLPRSILFWRALTHWLGGLGILSLFLALSFQGSDTHLILGAESHKISTGRPAPGLHHTVTILWGIYAFFTAMAALVLWLTGMPLFSAVCHAMAALSTGGYSTHDLSIQFYGQNGHANAWLYEYVLAGAMLLGGMNFLVHYRVLRGDARALIDHLEVRWWWWLIAGFTALISLECLLQSGWIEHLRAGFGPDLLALEQTFRMTFFQVVSVLTTTGFTTQDIGSAFFGGLAQQLFLVMMIIGGCVGSTAGGIKVLRVAVLNKMVFLELFKCRVSPRTSSGLVVDRKLLPEAEGSRIAALFYAWIALLVTGGCITALFTDHGPLASFSGMCSALGNIGPCFISPADIIVLPAVVKLTFIFGMLAGRLEILPVLLLFSRKAWQ